MKSKGFSGFFSFLAKYNALQFKFMFKPLFEFETHSLFLFYFFVSVVCTLNFLVWIVIWKVEDLKGVAVDDSSVLWRDTDIW